MDLGLELSDRGGTPVVTLRGEIDVATAPRVREQVVALVADGAWVLVLDLEEVEFIDSTGLGVLVGALKRVRTHGGDLHLAAVPPRVAKVLSITGLDGVFPVHDSVDAAVAAASATPMGA
jgi:anti-sigma B factor antagonist